MNGIKHMAGLVTGVMSPMLAVASDFRWPEFHLDRSPVEHLDLNGFCSQISENLGSLGTIIFVGVLVAAVWGYAKALTEVKAGRLVVYRDWGDFIKSAAWVLLVPVGLAWFSNSSSSGLAHLIGFAAAIYGLCCFWHMVSGAFKNNVGKGKWLSLFARFAVIFLLVFALAKLNEEFENYKRGKYGYKYRYFSFMRGVLLPLAIFSWVFYALIQPMIGLQYLRINRNSRRW